MELGESAKALTYNLMTVTYVRSHHAKISYVNRHNYWWCYYRQYANVCTFWCLAFAAQ